MPELLTKPEELLDIGSNACEDCPDVNPNPPDRSECPHFDSVTYDFPVCTREDGFDAQMRQFVGPINFVGSLSVLNTQGTRG